MTRRERVLKAINHEEPDRVPIDLGAHFSTGISAFAYQNLREYLGLPVNDIEVPDYSQMLARVDEDVLERFNCDCILLNSPWANPKRWNPRGRYSFLMPDKMNLTQNEAGDWIASNDNKQMRMPTGGFFFDGEWLNISDYDGFEDMIKKTAPRAEHIYKETDYFTMLMTFSAFFHGLDHACDMYTDPEDVVAAQKELLTNQLQGARLVIDHLGKYIQCIAINADLGMQDGPMISPDMFEKFCYPYLKELCSFIHNNSDLKIFIHTCGAIEPLLQMLIDAGIDIINPVQISAKGMDPALLKQKYGKNLCFWGGGCNTQTVLGTGSVEDVRQNVKELVDIFKPGGGFVFNQVHNVMGNVPVENIVAMLDTAFEVGGY